MNADVLSNIVGFCDIDSRRALGPGYGIQDLKRNVEFDRKMQAILDMRKSSIHSSQRVYREYWYITLNDKMRACFANHSFYSGKSHIETTVHSYVPYYHRCNASYTCEFHDSMDKISSILLPEPYIEIRAQWKDGKWIVKKNQYQSRNHPMLQQLGYTLVDEI
jgi:hypothetical protein